MAPPTSPDQRPSITASMLSSGKYSDMTIICKGKVFKVHRCVVCLQSKPLAAAVDGKFKEGVTKEIDLDDNEPEIVERMLAYLYNSDYSDNREPGTATPTPASRPRMSKKKGSRSMDYSDTALLINTQVFIIADKYDIQDLKQLAREKYEDVVPHTWDSSSFVASLKLIYEETLESDRLLKDVAVNMAGQHMKKLVDREEFVDLCKNNGVIAFDVMMASLGRLGETNTGTTRGHHGITNEPSKTLTPEEEKCFSCGEYFVNCYC